jgi:hypothetical protein
MSETAHLSIEENLAKLPKPSLDFLLAEYSALRSEILKRGEMQFQLVSLCVIAVGTFLALGSTTAILTYPILAMFLAAAYAQNELRLRQVSAYIKVRIEEKLLDNDLGWQHAYASTANTRKSRSLRPLASRGIVIGTQALALLVSALGQQLYLEDIVLLVLDSLALLLTLFFFRQQKLDLEL